MSHKSPNSHPNVPPNHKNQSALFLLRWLFNNFIRQEIKSVIIAAIFLTIIALTTGVNAWLIQPMLDEIFINKASNILWIISFGILLNAIIKGLASFYQSTVLRILEQKIVALLQMKLYRHLIYSDAVLLDKYSSGKLMSRFVNDINMIRRSITDIFVNSTCEIITLLALIGVMFYQSVELALIAILVFPVAAILIGILGRRVRKIAHNMQGNLTNLTIRLDETFKNIGVIRSYCREEYEIKAINSVMQKQLVISTKAAKVDAIASPMMEIVGSLAIVMVIWYGGSEVIIGKATPGSFFSFLTAVLMAYRPLKSLSRLNTSLQEGLASCRRILDILDQKPTIVNGANSVKITKFDSDIRFVDVSFAYPILNPKATKKRAVRHLNFTIPFGKAVAVVGYSGAGKSTIFSLLQRFYDVNNGAICIGDQDIRNISISSLRGAIAFVGQEVNLFDANVIENIRYGRLDATDEEVMVAAKLADAHDFIMELPDRYNNQIGQNGARLSGGQKQRISIARAILKNAPILLLDEATSALDSDSESQIQAALERLRVGKTTIIIAHRLSTIIKSDIIYFMSDGKIVEAGNHNELLGIGGGYAKFYEKYADVQNRSQP